jgi:hypothetical protein
MVRLVSFPAHTAAQRMRDIRVTLAISNAIGPILSQAVMAPA